jgi:SAM-dependent methyltransferase
MASENHSALSPKCSAVTANPNIVQRSVREFLLRFGIASLLVWQLTNGAVFAQADHPVSGRRIAPVMGVGGAQWLERSERELEEMPETALNEIGLKPGMTVADVGTGVGYFAIRLARRVGPTGHVYANDVQPEMLTMLRQRAKNANVDNIIPVLGGEADPKLPLNTMDLVMLVDVYHEFSQPQRMLRKLRSSLKDEGRLVLLEYRKEDPTIPIRAEHKMSVEEAKAEVEAEGFELERVSEALPRQHILIFKKKLAQ